MPRYDQDQAGSRTKERKTTFEYSPTGQRSKIVDNKGTADQTTTEYAYDRLGRLKIKQSPVGTLSYNYANVGNVNDLSA